MSLNKLEDFYCATMWRPGRYRFFGLPKPCWYRTVWSINGFHNEETLSQYGVIRHRSVKFYRYLERVPLKEITNAHDKLRENHGSFDWRLKTKTFWLDNQSARKTFVMQSIDSIKELEEKSEKIFQSIVSFLKIEEDENKIGWLNDVVYHGADFNYIWKERLKQW